MHYGRVERGKPPEPGYVWAPPSDSDRFWSKVAVAGPDDCWIWQASLKPTGYGQFKVKGKTVSAHRFAYEDRIGPIPDGLVIDHLCQRRQCQNPAHLDPVPPSVNVQRGYGPAVAAAREKQRGRERVTCNSGHAYTKENTYINPDGERVCRTCRKARRSTYGC